MEMIRASGGSLDRIVIAAGSLCQLTGVAVLRGHSDLGLQQSAQIGPWTDDFELAPDRFKYSQAAIEMIPSMCGHDADPQQGLAGRDRREQHHIG